MIQTKGKQYRFKMSNNLADVIGYILFEDNTFFHLCNDGVAPLSINKSFVVSYREMVE